MMAAGTLGLNLQVRHIVTSRAATRGDCFSRWHQSYCAHVSALCALGAGPSCSRVELKSAVKLNEYLQRREGDILQLKTSTRGG